MQNSRVVSAHVSAAEEYQTLCDDFSEVCLDVIDQLEKYLLENYVADDALYSKFLVHDKFNAIFNYKSEQENLESIQTRFLILAGFLLALEKKLSISFKIFDMDEQGKEDSIKRFSQFKSQYPNLFQVDHETLIEARLVDLKNQIEQTQKLMEDEVDELKKMELNHLLDKIKQDIKAKDIAVECIKKHTQSLHEIKNAYKVAREPLLNIFHPLSVQSQHKNKKKAETMLKPFIGYDAEKVKYWQDWVAEYKATRDEYIIEINNRLDKRKTQLRLKDFVYNISEEEQNLYDETTDKLVKRIDQLNKGIERLEAQIEVASCFLNDLKNIPEKLTKKLAKDILRITTPYNTTYIDHDGIFLRLKSLKKEIKRIEDDVHLDARDKYLLLCGLIWSLRQQDVIIFEFNDLFAKLIKLIHLTPFAKPFPDDLLCASPQEWYEDFEKENPDLKSKKTLTNYRHKEYQRALDTFYHHCIGENDLAKTANHVFDAIKKEVNLEKDSLEKVKKYTQILKYASLFCEDPIKNFGEMKTLIHDADGKPSASKKIQGLLMVLGGVALLTIGVVLCAPSVGTSFTLSFAGAGLIAFGAALIGGVSLMSLGSMRFFHGFDRGVHKQLTQLEQVGKVKAGVCEEKPNKSKPK